jgi:serpin B
MADVLSEMGMELAFTPYADFSGMTGSNDLYIGHVIHKAYIDVNEEGTEAAAATAVVMMETTSAGGYDVPVFKADKPFSFIIKDNRTGSILFMGDVANPLA